MRTKTLLALAAVLFACSLPTEARAEPTEKLTVGTLIPRHSAWGKVFRVWALAVKKKTKGRLKLKFYWNSSQGDEATMVGKVRAGQLDGAALGARGLSDIHRPILALQMPGLFFQWADMDRATNATFKQFQAAFEKEGFYLSSIGAVGRARALTQGRAVRTPEDLKGMRPVGLRGDLIGPVFSSIMGTTRVPLSVAEILPALNQGRVNVVVAPSLIAEQLQWAPLLDHVTDEVLGVGVCAMVFSKSRMDRLDPDLVEVLQKTGAKAGKILNKRIRRMDDEAYLRLKKRMTVVRLNDAQRRQWDDIFKRIRKRLSQGTFPRPLVEKLEGLSRR